MFGDLKLQELAHHVVHAVCLHNLREVVVHQDIDGRLLRNFYASDAHGEANVCGPERRAIHRTATKNTHNLTELAVLLDE